MHDIISLSEAMKYDKMAIVPGLHFKCQHLNNFLVSMIWSQKGLIITGLYFMYSCSLYLCVDLVN